MRLLIALGVLAVSGSVALAFNRFGRTSHPSITVQAEGDRPGIVLFTSLDCATCKRTVAMLRRGRLPFREITHELEPQRFTSWGVVAVPLTVVVDRDGEVVDLMTGVPSSRRVGRAVSDAGIDPTA